MTKRNFILPVQILIVSTIIFISVASAQTTFPVNGIADPMKRAYAFINATIVKDGNTTLSNATMIIRDRKIVSVGNNITVPADAVTIDCKGKYIYPSFIDIYSDYGIPVQPRTQTTFNFNAPGQISF
ncbi:MAG: hypothetical protein WKF59_06675 [Chitinophagaceae bacterium]